jgi:hypothetical protein
VIIRQKPASSGDVEKEQGIVLSFFDRPLFDEADNAIQQCVVFLQSHEQRAGCEPAETTKNSTVWVSVDSDIETDRVEA